MNCLGNWAEPQIRACEPQQNVHSSPVLQMILTVIICNYTNPISTTSVLVKCVQLLSCSQPLQILRFELLKTCIHILLCNREITSVACNAKSQILRALISLTGQSLSSHLRRTEKQFNGIPLIIISYFNCIQMVHQDQNLIKLSTV